MENSPTSDDSDEYAPPSRPSPFRKRYVGAEGVAVVASYDGARILVTATEETPQSLVEPSIPSDAADEFADMDFLAETAGGRSVHINTGEISYVSWIAAAFFQAKYSMPEQTITVPEDNDTQYIYLKVKVRTYTSTVGDIQTPWEVTTTSTYAYARLTEWQEIDSRTPPVYFVSEDGDLLTDVGQPAEDIYFRCLIASVDASGTVYPHHVGAVTLPQGYIASLATV